MKLKVFIGFITIFLILGCPNDSSSTPELLITAEVSPSSVSGYDVTVVVSLESAAVTGASITINGTTIAESGTTGTYTGNLATATTGDTLSFSATKDGYTATASAIIPGVVTTTSPPDVDATAGVRFDHNPALDMNIVWNALTGSDAVDEIEIFVDKSSTAGQTTDYSATVSGTATSHTIPGGTFETPDVTTTLLIRTKRNTTITGDNIKIESEFEVINNLTIDIVYNPA